MLRPRSIKCDVCGLILEATSLSYDADKSAWTIREHDRYGDAIDGPDLCPNCAAKENA